MIWDRLCLKLEPSQCSELKQMQISFPCLHGFLFKAGDLVCSRAIVMSVVKCIPLMQSS